MRTNFLGLLYIREHFTFVNMCYDYMWGARGVYRVHAPFYPLGVTNHNLQWHQSFGEIGIWVKII